MANFTWTFDSPTGTYKSHAMSARLYEAAVENSVFMDHVRPVDGFGRNSGETVTLIRVGNIAEPADPRLQEAVRIPEDDFELSAQTITVTEIGRSVPFTSLSQDLSRFDIENPIQRKLRDQMRLALDTMAASAFKRAAVKYIPTGTAGSPTFTSEFDGVVSNQATRNVQVFDIERIRDLMFDDLHVPPLDNDDYVAIMRTQALRGIKDDADWEEWHKYTDPQAKFNGEVGRIESVRFIETNHANALGKNLGSGSDLGEGVVFGEDAVAMAEAMTPELRAAIPQDFGRQRAVAWYGILEFDQIWDTTGATAADVAGEARIVHITST